jgi:hypothetical protein
LKSGECLRLLACGLCACQHRPNFSKLASAVPALFPGNTVVKRLPDIPAMFDAHFGVPMTDPPCAFGGPASSLTDLQDERDVQSSALVGPPQKLGPSGP